MLVVKQSQLTFVCREILLLRGSSMFPPYDSRHFITDAYGAKLEIQSAVLPLILILVSRI